MPEHDHREAAADFAEIAEFEADLRAEHCLPADATYLGSGLGAWEMIEADGRTAFWLIDHDAPAGEAQFTSVPHEQLGRLPEEWAQRVGIPCGVLTRTSGRPCRNVVGQVGDRCWRHGGAA